MGRRETGRTRERGMGAFVPGEQGLPRDIVESDVGHRKMEVFFPKFKLNQRYEMHELLKQMGIRRLFSTSADLSELSAMARNLQVSRVSQGPCWGPGHSMQCH